MLLRFVIFLSFLVVLPFNLSAQDAKRALNDKLYEATRTGNLAEVKSLLDQGADVNAKFRYGTTALFKAAERGHTDVVKLLLERGADVNVKDTFYGATAMTWALQNEHVETVAVLLEKDASSVDEVLTTGAGSGNVGLVRAALAKGGLKPETLSGALVSAISGDEKNSEIAEMLKKAGAVLPMQVASEILQTYVGKYKSVDGTELTFTLKDNVLLGGQGGGPSLPWSAIDNVSFKPVGFDGLTITFVVEGTKVTGLSVKQGQNTTQFKRIEETK